MADASMVADKPVRLHLPAILQNPVNRSQRQVEAFNAQQREKVAARRDTRAIDPLSSNGRGKRYVRRKDNAAFTSNPHIVQPTRADFIPPVPLQYRRIQPTFPPCSVTRMADASGSSLPSRDPFSQDSRAGAFSTSLKGTRALLRKKGRRAEELVGTVETALRAWLMGEGLDLSAGSDGTDWRVVDDTLVEIGGGDEQAEPSTSPSTSRRMPERHQLRDQLPPLPMENGQCPAILELSRSPAHLTWAVAEGFERLVIHLLVRYYELISWSEDHQTISGQSVRVTHIILPSVAQPRLPVTANSLLTPVNTDLSASSSSDKDSSTELGSDSDTVSDPETEMGYSLDDHEGDTSFATVTPELIEQVSHIDINDLELRRVSSNSSSMYASSEGDSDFGMADSLTLPPPPVNGGWTSVTFSDAESEFGDVPVPKRAVVANIPNGAGHKNWEERPTFFEYLYGA